MRIVFLWKIKINMEKRIVCPPIEEIEKLRQPLTNGEQVVLDYFLDQLPPSWEIYLQPHLNGLRPDFVLLHPQRGIAVYEVKDWNLDSMEYFVDVRGNRPPILKARLGNKTFSIEDKNPVTKIDLYKAEIYTLYCPRLASKTGFGAIVSGIIFPFSSEERLKTLLAPLRHYYGQDKYPNLYPLIGRNTLRDQREWVLKKHVLPSAHRDDERINEEIASDLRHWLVEPDSTVEQRRPLIDELSDKQRNIVLTRSEKTGFRRVRGPAGSGKSFVLAGRAAQLAADGRKVLIITFNITLINYILDLAVRFAQTGKVRKQIVALNFHFWCRRVATETGHYADYHDLWHSGKDIESLLKQLLAESTHSWLTDLGEEGKWDAVLVDEGQDFELSWWLALRQALYPMGEALLCADKIQNIYEVTPWTEKQMKGAGFSGPWNTLDESIRLSPALCELAKTFINEFLPGLDDLLPEPVNREFEFKTILKWWQVTRNQAAQSCVNALLEIVHQSTPPISYADLTCIVATANIGREVIRLLHEKCIASIHTFGDGESALDEYYDSQRKKLAFFKGDARVKITTIHSFKGWESKALVVHIENANSKASLALAYVGLTRLKKDEFGCYLTLVNEAPELISFGEKWPVYLDLTKNA